MIVYILAFSLSICLALHAESKKNKYRIAWIILSCVPIVLVAGLRASSVGIDTDYYPLPFFAYSLEMNLPDMMAAAGCEPGFSIVIWTLSRITQSFNLTLVVIHILMIAPVVWVSWKLKLRPIPIVLLTYCCVVFPWSINLMRQALASSILLIAFYYAHIRNLPRYLLFIIIATLMHNTGLLGLIIYPICIVSNLEVSKRNRMTISILLVTIIASVSLLIFPEAILYPLSHLKASYGNIIDELHQGSFNFFMTVYPAVSAAIGFVTCVQKSNIEDERLLFSLSLILSFSAILAPFSMLNQALSRLGEMYLVFSPLLNAIIFRENKKYGFILVFVSMLIFLWVYCYGNASGALPYEFFWSEK